MKTVDDFLKEIVAEIDGQEYVLGRIACAVCASGPVVEKHLDGRKFTVICRNRGSHWRHTVLIGDSDQCLVQVDVHEDGDIRVESWEPTSIQVSKRDGVLSITRLHNG